MATPSRVHWYPRPLPVAVTLNVAVAPAVTLRAAGCDVMAGAPMTVSVAPLLATLPSRSSR